MSVYTEDAALGLLIFAGRLASRQLVLRGADLSGAELQDAVLEGADLQDADLQHANLADANLRGADMQRASLRSAHLLGAKLEGATLPDGRRLEQWQADPLAGLCDNDEARSRAVAAWGNHSWDDCPVRASNGYQGVAYAPEHKRALVATFVALFDGEHLPKPEEP